MSDRENTNTGMPGSGMSGSGMSGSGMSGSGMSGSGMSGSGMSEDDLRARLAGLGRDVAGGGLDARRVIARSRARRRPRQLAAGAVGALALAGISVLAVQTTLLPGPATGPSAVTLEQSDSNPAPSAPDVLGLKRAPANRTNLCEGTLAELAPSSSGLIAEADFGQSAPVGAATIDGMIRLTNTGDAPVAGSVGTPVVTLSRDGVVLWHTNGTVGLAETPIDLDPGETAEIAASFSPVTCTVEDDSAGQFRADLPPVPAGDYQLSAVIDFVPDAASDTGGSGDASPEIDLVSGPASPIVLG